jgi:NAD+ synthase
MDDHKTGNPAAFTKEFMRLDVEKETERIVSYMEETVHQQLHRQGIVVGLSGGIDSSVVLALSLKALGADKVIGLLLPEKESSAESGVLAQTLADTFGVKTYIEDITGALQGYSCYERRNAAIKRVIPQFETGWNVKIVLPGDLLDSGTLNIFTLVVDSPSGGQYRQRIPLKEYYQIVASSNFKQRSRTNMLYYYAECNNYAVAGTPNKNEHDLGFFVKFGDGGYDIAPIRHLYKTQVYQMAEYLGIPEEICSRPPTTDTYPGGGTQEEFFYRIPFEILDLIWAGFENGFSSTTIAGALSLTENQVERVIADVIRKKHATEYLRRIPSGL